ncbi:MAG: HAD hydrolase-like protein [Rhodomicrobium sp.]|nr:HAD hydrolase-like protein [Rhodomicrobium sp.]
MHNSATIVFDLDGTLAHTSPDIAAALNSALRPYSVELTLRETERLVGGGLRALLEKALALKSVDVPPDEIDVAFERLLVSYRAEPAARTALHGWVAGTMIEMHGAGARIAVCSNKAEDLAVRILDALDASRWIHAIVGHVPERKKKPDPEPLLLSIRDAGGIPGSAMLIGDSSADVGAARAAGIPVVLVPHGYGSKDVRDLAADRIVSNAEELRAAIDTLLPPAFAS